MANKQKKYVLRSSLFCCVVALTAAAYAQTNKSLPAAATVKRATKTFVQGPTRGTVDVLLGPNFPIGSFMAFGGGQAAPGLFAGARVNVHAPNNSTLVFSGLVLASLANRQSFFGQATGIASVLTNSSQPGWTSYWLMAGPTLRGQLGRRPIAFMEVGGQVGAAYVLTPPDFLASPIPASFQGISNPSQAIWALAAGLHIQLRIRFTPLVGMLLGGQFTYAQPSVALPLGATARVAIFQVLPSLGMYFAF